MIGWRPTPIERVHAAETLAAENVLYPDLAAHGQLATAIHAAATAA
jgi:hypothetical protein